METRNTSDFTKLKKNLIPLVLFDCVCADIQASKMLVNNCEITSDAVKLLNQRGYQKISHITVPGHLNVFREKQRGYEHGIAAHKLSYDKCFFINKAFSIYEGILATGNICKTILAKIIFRL